MSTATKPKPAPPKRLAKIHQLVAERRKLWPSGGNRGYIKDEAANMRRFRTVTRELTALLWAHRKPVPLADGVILRLNTDGDGPAFVQPPTNPGYWSRPEFYRDFMTELDRKDAYRFGSGRKAVIQ